MSIELQQELELSVGKASRGWRFHFEDGFVGELRHPPHSDGVLTELVQQRCACGVRRPEITDFDRAHTLILIYKSGELVASCRAEFREIYPVEILGLYDQILCSDHASEYFYCAKLGVSKHFAAHNVINLIFYLLEYVGRSEGKSAVVANCIYRVKRFYKSKGFLTEENWRFNHPVLNNDSIIIVKPQDDLFFYAAKKNSWMEEIKQ